MGSNSRTKCLAGIEGYFVKLMIPLLIVYSLGYMCMIKGLYITSLSQKTLVNIEFHQHSQEILRKEVLRYYDQERQKTQKNDSVSQKQNMREEIIRDEESETQKRQKSDSVSQEQNKKEKMKIRLQQMKNLSQLYDHAVLRRIDTLGVFYISAIADCSSTILLEKERKVAANTIINADTFLGAGNEGDDDVDLEYDSMNNDQDLNEQDPDLNNLKMSNLSPFDKVVNSKQFVRKYNNAKHFNFGSAHTKGIVTLNGWDEYKTAKKYFHCCYKYGDTDTTKAVPILQKNIWNVCKIKVVRATQFVCPLFPANDPQLSSNLVTMSHRMMLPTKVGMSSDTNCEKKNIHFIDIEKTETRPNDSIALCSKVIYGHYPPDKVIEWFEFNILMGVEQILMFTYNLAAETRSVLQYYEESGLLITKEYDYPLKMRYPRKLGEKNVLSFHDEQVTLFDCMERFHGYGYVAILDIDEFLVPANATNGTWKTMLERLLHVNENASGFAFQTQIFTLDWGISNPNDHFFVTKYIKRTRPMWDRRKNIIIPSRVVRGSAWTHSFVSVEGYQPAKVPTHIANMFHYRKCRLHWYKFDTCTSKRRRYTDKTMLTVIDRIYKRVVDLKNKLLQNATEQTFNDTETVTK